MKAAHRFFVEGVGETGALVEIGGSDAHKILHVLRLRTGDRIEVVDSGSTAYQASLELGGGGVRAKLVEPLPTLDAPALLVNVAQAVPKGAKMDFVVEKATELGAAAVLPFYCERSVAHAASPEKLARWRRLARAAAQQCGRRDVPQIGDPVAFDALLGGFALYDAVLFPWELAERVPLRERLPALLEGVRRALVVIGPEGGFTHDEAEAATAHRAHHLWLGPRILRTETAALAVLAVIGAFASY